jgi:hypothetical protein
MKPNLKRREKLTPQRVIELFDYEPSTGRLVRKSTGGSELHGEFGRAA